MKESNLQCKDILARYDNANISCAGDYNEDGEVIYHVISWAAANDCQTVPILHIGNRAIPYRDIKEDVLGGFVGTRTDMSRGEFEWQGDFKTSESQYSGLPMVATISVIFKDNDIRDVTISARRTVEGPVVNSDLLKIGIQGNVIEVPAAKKALDKTLGVPNSYVEKNTFP